MSNKWADNDIERYPDYFQTDHWFNLKWKYIYGNKNAKCWICNRTDKLLIHHISYKNLFAEKLFNDIYILCFDCHNKTHFWFFNLIKTPLTTDWLLLSMRLNRTLFYTQSGRFGLSLLWFLIILFLIPINIAKFVLRLISIQLGKLAWIILKIFLKNMGIEVIT